MCYNGENGMVRCLKNLKYIKEPGFVYDLLFIFSLKFNFEDCCANFVNETHKNDDIAFYTKIQERFDEIPDELLPFFYIRNNGRNFLSYCYFSKQNERFLTDYSLQSVQTAISDQDKFIYNMLRFYFEKESKEKIKEVQGSIKEISELIKNSDYSDLLKSHLYAFFIDPTPSIQKLSYSLMEKGYQLKQYHEQNYGIILEMQQQMDLSKMSAQLKEYMNVDIESFETIDYTVCLICKNIMCAFLIQDNAFLMCGFDYDSFIDSELNKNLLPEIDVFGNAIAEKNRVAILNYLLERQEATLKDVEAEFGMSQTNAYYHLSLLQKANLIIPKNRGRTILYTLNKGFFRIVCDALRKYTDEEGR